MTISSTIVVGLRLCARVHEWVYISPGGNFELIPSIQKNSMLWVGACCLLSFYSPITAWPTLTLTNPLTSYYNIIPR